MIRTTLSAILSILLISITSLDVRAQGELHTYVSGKVLDQDGNALPGASIVLIDSHTGLQYRGTAADTSGAFEIQSTRSGSFELVASFLGYAGHSETLVLRPGESRTVTIQLRDTSVPQEGVVVTGARAKRQLNPITVSNMTARELEQQPSMKDLPVLLATLPSITYHSENGNGIGYSTLRLRGFDQRRIAISINGIPQNDPEDFNVFWINFFDVQGAIQDIQVQRGAGSSLYGPTAIGGAINIAAMPYKAEPYAFVEAGYGAFKTQRYTVEANSGLIDNRYVVFGRFSRLLTDGYRDWSWSEFYRFFVGAVRYGERSTLTLQAYGGPQRDALSFSGIPRAANEKTLIDPTGASVDRRYNFSGFTSDVERFHQPHVELFHDYRLSDRASFHQALFWVKGEGYFEFGGTFRSADYLRIPDGWRDLSDAERALPLFLSAPDVSLLFRAYLDQWQIGWLPRLMVNSSAGETTIGAEARLHRSLRWGRAQEANGLPEEMVGSDADYRAYQFRGEKVITSVFGSHLMRPIDRVAVQADLQLTYRQFRHYDERFFGRSFDVPYVFANPRLGVTLNPERPLSFYTSVAVASREPRLKSVYDGEEAGAGFIPRFEELPDGSLDFDSPLVKPERLLDIELGGALVQPRYRLVATAYLMQFRDEIVPSGGLDQFGVPRSGNADRTRHLGVEVEGAVRLVPGLDLNANATLSRNRFVRFDEYVSDAEGAELVSRDGNQIAGFPEQIVNAGLTYTYRGLTARLAARYTGRQYIDNSGGRRSDGAYDESLTVDPSLVLDAGLRFAFSRQSVLDGLELALDVNNVLDHRVLLYGNVGATGPQFFPLATRHLFASMRYTIR